MSIGRRFSSSSARRTSSCKQFDLAEKALTEAVALRIRRATGTVQPGTRPGAARQRRGRAGGLRGRDGRQSEELRRAVQPGQGRCSRKGALADAVTRFRAAVEARPEFAEGYLYLAKALLDGGNLAGAEQAATQGLAKAPDRSDRATRPLRAGRRLQPPGTRERGGARGRAGAGAGARAGDGTSASVAARRSSLGLIAGAVAGCRSGSGDVDRPPPRARHLVLVTIDTLRADRLGAYGNTAVPTPTSTAWRGKASAPSTRRRTCRSRGRHIPHSSPAATRPSTACATTSRCGSPRTSRRWPRR